MPHFLVADGAALLFAAAALVWLSRRALTEPRPGARRSAHLRHRDARRRWLDGLVGKPSELLAVHTLRNWIMSTTFLASTSILLALGLLAAAFSNDKLSAFAHGLNLLGNESGQLWMLSRLPRELLVK
ncbi:MAG: DUF599 family protein [Proteobacteria bacterium]|nr:DUF599 family protein [Pseudomonadota bacterium]